MKFKKKLRKGVFFVVYSFEKEKPKYLLLKRKLHWTGWEFPKAGVEVFETKRHAVKRETKEETGLTPVKIKKHNYRGGYLYSKECEDRKGFSGQTFLLYSVEVNPGKVKIGKKEHSDFKWLSFRESLEKLTHKNQKKSLRIVNDWLIKNGKNKTPKNRG